MDLDAWHHLRHFAATALIGAGEDLFVVSRVLGHTSVATTASFYGHVQPAMLQRRRTGWTRSLRRQQEAEWGQKWGDGRNEKPLRDSRRGYFVREWW